MKIKTFFIIFFISNLIIISNTIFANNSDKINYDFNLNEIAISAPSAILIEKETGEILYSKDSELSLYPASTVKIMTAIIAIENANLSDIITISSNAITSVPSSYTLSNIKPEENLTLENLLYALLIPSGNDAANAIAEYIGGNISNFSVMMNKKAKELGCKNTNFTNPNGVHDENMHTTAYDLSLIAKYAMNNTTFRHIVSTIEYTLPSSNKYPQADRTFNNSNHLILPESKDYYEYATGIKTGFTNAAQNCLVASAKKGNVEFIVVILGSTESNWSEHSKFSDAKNMFNYAFDNYYDYYNNLYLKKLYRTSSVSSKIIETFVDPNMIKDEKNSPRWGYVIYLIAKFTLIIIAILYISYLFVMKVKRFIYKRTHAEFHFKN